MYRRSNRPLLLFVSPLAFAVAACAEDLETGSTCPALCPGQGIVVFDTVITPAYVFDSTLVGFPAQGLENPLLLASRGDSLDVRVVVRFDGLPRQYRPIPIDTLRPVTYVQEALLSLRLAPAGLALPSEYHVDVYDVDDPSVVDTIASSVIPLFAPSRLLGTWQGDETLTASVRVLIPLDSAYLLALLQDSTRSVRIGIRVRSAESVQIALSPSVDGGAGPTLEYRPSSDSTVAKVGPVNAFSETPDPAIVADDLTDYAVVVTAPDIALPGRFAIGGLPAARAYLRFELPRWLTDSVNILRADLELTQDPVVGVADADSVFINTHLVVAGPAVTEPRRAATLLSLPDIFTNTLRLVPSDSGVRILAMNALVRQWTANATVAGLPAALVFRSAVEGAEPQGVRFFGYDAADPSVRPRLRISYTPVTVFGRP